MQPPVYTAPARPSVPRGRIRSITWTVPSATTRGVEYEARASVDDGRLECTCLAGASGKVRWHIKSVASGQAGKPHVRVTPASRRPSTVNRQPLPAVPEVVAPKVRPDHRVRLSPAASQRARFMQV
jgi:hypothetical protein